MNDADEQATVYGERRPFPSRSAPGDILEWAVQQGGKRGDLVETIELHNRANLWLMASHGEPS